jgi:lysozyme family protein
MAQVEEAFSYVIAHEDSTLSGVVTDEPGGGTARFGVNSIANPRAVTDGFFEMPKDKALGYAQELFVVAYWGPIGAEAIFDQSIANKYAGLAYNLGVQESTRIVQRAVNSQDVEIVVAVDGKMGPRTLACINQADPEVLLRGIKREGVKFYEDLAQHNVKFESSLRGWLARVNA